MKKNTLEPQGLDRNQQNLMSLHQYFEGNEFNIPNNDYDINGYTGNMPSLHSVAQSYEQNKKLKEVINTNMDLKK